ncbi:MAG: hypothetical protein R3C40_09715 [Parvularculaceae bacterium]
MRHRPPAGRPPGRLPKPGAAVELPAEILLSKTPKLLRPDLLAEAQVERAPAPPS